MDINIEIKVDKERFSSQICINGKWFKEVCGAGNVYEILESIGHSLYNDEDLKLNFDNE